MDRRRFLASLIAAPFIPMASSLTMNTPVYGTGHNGDITLTASSSNLIVLPGVWYTISTTSNGEWEMVEA